jgi:hypothetical protein
VGKQGSPQEVARRVRLVQKVSELARREVTLAIPAAKRAVSHGLQEFFKKFSEEYAKERKKP